MRRSARVGPIKPIRGSDGLEDPTKRHPFIFRGPASALMGDMWANQRPTGAEFHTRLVITLRQLIGQYASSRQCAAGRRQCDKKEVSVPDTLLENQTHVDRGCVFTSRPPVRVGKLSSPPPPFFSPARFKAIVRK